MTTTVHGAYSPRRIRAKARSQRRRFLLRLGVRAADLDACTRERLLAWSIAAAQVDLFVAAGEVGSRNFWTGFNSAHRCLRELEARVRELGLDRTAPSSTAALEAHLARRANGSAGNGQGAA